MTPAGKDIFLSDVAGLTPGNKQNLLSGMVSSRIQRMLDFDSIVYTEWALWCSCHSSWLQIQKSRVRLPALPDFLSFGSGTGST
jgi:hypothetical protein